MWMRAEESGGSKCRPVMGRIGVEAVSRCHPARKRADFRRVPHYENGCDTSTESCAKERPAARARSGSIFEWADAVGFCIDTT